MSAQTTRQLDDAAALVVRLELIKASPEKVWDKVSSEAGLREWLGPKTYEPRLGGRILFDVQHGETRWVMWGTVQSFEPARELSFTWQEFDTAKLLAWPAATIVRISLSPQDGGTLVQLEHSGFEKLPDGGEQFKGYSEGWASLNDLDALAQMCEE
jgi:uncharacterized protein YndB with AHSA1/START domain